MICAKKLHEVELSFWYVFVTKSIDLNRNQKCSTKPISVFLWPNCFDVSKQFGHKILEIGFVELSCVATVSQLLCRSLPLYMRCLCWYKVLWWVPTASFGKDWGCTGNFEEKTTGGVAAYTRGATTSLYVLRSQPPGDGGCCTEPSAPIWARFGF